MDVLDIGGGFCAGADSLGPGRIMGGVPAAVNAALDTHFPISGGARVIAEPGRYFAEGAATLACMVYGVRDGGAKPGAGGGGDAARDYWITDGEALRLSTCADIPSWTPCGGCCAVLHTPVHRCTHVAVKLSPFASEGSFDAVGSSCSA